jgi:wobble nucleotide-excising tRNase
VKAEEENAHVRFDIVRNGKKAYNLSEGECSLIAFCYFMAKLDDVESNGKNLIIWIDDPISSLDSNHVFFVYSLLRAEIVEASKYEQLFISTHNLDFLKYLKRLTRKENDRNVRYFLIKRKDKISTIEKMPNYLQKYVTEFNFLFHEIYKCSKIETIDDSNYTCFYNFGNNARKFLEILMFYYYPENQTTGKTREILWRRVSPCNIDR